MKRGDVYDARLSPTEGSEQAGIRPVIIVSRDAINRYSPVIVVVPLTKAANVSRDYPSNVHLSKSEGGL
ncbi:MAG: type II toxin-antitoxin system PemK/MazF family toxin, partial [Chloroflexi bacterium]|nr:type II toxin-antitoxin system PemK/MazF family toxin [Chloroflexota bacterium]